MKGTLTVIAAGSKSQELSGTLSMEGHGYNMFFYGKDCEIQITEPVIYYIDNNSIHIKGLRLENGRTLTYQIVEWHFEPEIKRSN